jgi:phenylalanyl-tRNA synthetase beta chain
VNISLNWLRDYIDCQLSVPELEALLRRAGLEVAGVKKRGVSIEKVVVAQVLESVQHPNADRLSVCKVDDGSGQPRQIVCGAKNYKIGDKVPLALPGAVMPGDFKIKTGKLRGVESEGMMCSAKELQLAEDAEGLLILDASSVPGTELKNLFPVETVLELEITPNRSDWLSHVGVAREIGVFTGKVAQVPRPALPKSIDAAGHASIEDAGCSYYTLRKISGVNVAPSPQWLVDRLISIGLRPINNIVDITNYVLFELGQPLHAFDAGKITGGIRARGAIDSERFQALDGQEYHLPAGTLVIADDNGPVALAGVMGGEGSGVTESTNDILLESAIFDPSRVRRASRALGVFSDSSYRFERGVDPDGVATASARAVELILQLAGGTAASELLVAGSVPARHAVTLRHDRARALLGTELSDADIDAALQRTGLEKGLDGQWVIPGYRRELTREADLIEEVARVVGIEDIQSRAEGIFAQGSSADAAYDFTMALRRKLAGAGFHEARTGTLISANAADLIGPSVSLKNPFGDDQSRLRNSLIPGLLAAVVRNFDQGAKSIPLFEAGRIFNSEGEFQRLALVATGERQSPDWRGTDVRPWDAFDLSGLVVRIAGATIQPLTNPPTPFGAAAVAALNGKRIGIVGQLLPSVARSLGIDGALLAAEFDLDAWLAVDAREKTVSPLPKFPASSRDIAFIAQLALPYGEVQAAIASLNEPLLESVKLFDLFTDPKGEKIPAEKKSLAVSLTFRSPERTLTTEEVNAATDRIKAVLREKTGVDLRE